jgi:hypothetical protein
MYCSQSRLSIHRNDRTEHLARPLEHAAIYTAGRFVFTHNDIFHKQLAAISLLCPASLEVTRLGRVQL